MTALAAAIMSAARDARDNGDMAAYAAMLATLDAVDPVLAAELRGES